MVFLVEGGVEEDLRKSKVHVLGIGCERPSTHRWYISAVFSDPPSSSLHLQILLAPLPSTCRVRSAWRCATLWEPRIHQEGRQQKRRGGRKQLRRTVSPRSTCPRALKTRPVGRKALCCSRAHGAAPLLDRLDQGQVGPDEWWGSSVSSFLLPHLFRASLRLFQHAVCVGARRLVWHRLMRVEDGLEQDFVEALLLDLADTLGSATAVVELLAPPPRCCLVRLTVRRSCFRCRWSSPPTPSLLVDPWLALVSIS